MNIKQKQEKIKRWQDNHGGADFNIKDRTVILFDGGIMSIESKKIRLPRICGKKKLSNGCVELIFTKKKYPHTEYRGTLWFEEINDTIKWFQSIKRLLKEIGYKTELKKK